ncbi:hydrolase [Salinithrix halophila]|uniref:Hydrolase n=1 Tax=Salinithrix halophila TaxID=1485204 RepID=A0ABV8JAG1_9BACL
MKKKTYYVAIHSGETFGEILQEKGASPYDFEIEATDEEVRSLNILLGNFAGEDAETFWDSHIPFQAYNERRENDGYDQTLEQVYQRIYELGTPETKQQMEEMGLLVNQRHQPREKGERPV